ncbi:iron-sulfur cluster assembly scaffold protein [Patescibacteria group bacterium]
MYTPTVLRHFKNPRNQGKMKNPTVIGEAGSKECGDTMKLYFKIASSKFPIYQKKEKIIEDIKFQTLGCAAAIASSSVLTEMVKGRRLDKVATITKQDVVKKLGGLPDNKIHCSLLAVDALKDAISKVEK